jgi:hypothetical protein
MKVMKTMKKQRVFKEAREETCNIRKRMFNFSFKGAMQKSIENDIFPKIEFLMQCLFNDNKNTR